MYTTLWKEYQAYISGNGIFYKIPGIGFVRNISLIANFTTGTFNQFNSSLAESYLSGQQQFCAFAGNKIAVALPFPMLVWWACSGDNRTLSFNFIVPPNIQTIGISLMSYKLMFEILRQGLL